MGSWRSFVLFVTVLALVAGCADEPSAPAPTPAGTAAPRGGGGGGGADGRVDRGDPAGTSCSDGDPCNGEETVDSEGTCLAGVPPAVDDGEPCTLDACDPSAGITHAACSAIDLTVATTTAQATQFLYTGANPVQTGVVAGTIDVRRAAVILGQVRGPGGSPLTGINIEVLGHPEYGATRTFADGMFAMAVNGGGALLVSYHGDGYLPVSRQVEVPWQDYARAADVVMTPYDGQVTVVDLGAQRATAVARGSVVSDADGVRQATVIFPPGTQAQMVLPGGATQPLTTLSVRATEYTVGESGPDAMPATLPPMSGYTYAAELSIDEAVAAGATSVEFTQPLPFYIENFLGFPVGMAVPVGYYDHGLGAWVPSANGRVIEIRGVATPWDCNWPHGPPDDACKPLDPVCSMNGDALPPPLPERPRGRA